MAGLIGRIAAPSQQQPEDEQAWSHLLDRLRRHMTTHARPLIDAAAQPDARPQLVTYIRNQLVRWGYGGEELPERLADQLAAEMIGYGPLDPLMRDENVTEIMVNGCDAVFVERDGRLEAAGIRFQSDQHVLQTIRRLIAPLGRRLDASRPFVDARLPDGSRLHATIPPISLQGPVLTIRRFPKRPVNVAALLRQGTLTPPLCRLLIRMVRARRQILISGGTGSGKTTLLNVLAALVPPGERIITLEEAAELRIRHPHVVGLETRLPNQEGEGEITLRDLVRNALRMRPDRVIVGEVRGAEAFDLVQAWNTGHRGSLSTIHANSAWDALTRLEALVMTAPDRIPFALARRLVRSTVDVVVQMERSGAHRRVREVLLRDAQAAGGYRQLAPHAIGGETLA